MIPKYYDFDHVRLLPQKGIVDSRDQCDASVTFGKHTFKLGVVPANMLCTIDEPLAVRLAQNNYFYIYHRFHHNNIHFIERMNKKGLLTSISVGVNSDSIQQIKEIKEKNLKVDYICIDIAHGHSVGLERMVKTIKDTLPDVFVIGGNICTAEAIFDLERWGCDATKLGIGPGLACETYKMTSVGSRDWQASMINELSNVAEKPVICDGGIRSVGHICVSFAMGAKMSMIGSLFSAFQDSPGDIVTGPDDKTYKEFFGSASEHTMGHKRYSEGCKVLVEAKSQTLLEFLDNDVTYGVRSCISYLGGKDMSIFNIADMAIVK